MKIKELLNENVRPLLKEDVVQKSSRFITGCDAPLFRGSKTVSDGFFERSIRQDRKPVDTSVINTLMFEMYFEEEFGIKNVRRRVSFMTHRDKIAKAYGSIVLAFPKNDNLLIASPDIGDFYAEDVWAFGGPSQHMLFQDYVDSVLRKKGAMPLKRNAGDWRELKNAFDDEEWDHLRAITKKFHNNIKSYRVMGPDQADEIRLWPSKPEIMVIGDSFCGYHGSDIEQKINYYDMFLDDLRSYL